MNICPTNLVHIHKTINNIKSLHFIMNGAKAKTNKQIKLEEIQSNFYLKIATL